MGRKNLGEVRRIEIIKAFYKVARKEGLENASIAKTANLIHINPSLIIHYFKNKESLIYGLVDYILSKYLEIFKIAAKPEDKSVDRLLKVLDNVFSHKWNKLFDDSVSYSCYSLVFRDKTIKQRYKNVLDSLRTALEQLIIDCLDEKSIGNCDPKTTADLIFVLVDGAYYYLSLETDKKRYTDKLAYYKKTAAGLLNIKKK